MILALQHLLSGTWLYSVFRDGLGPWCRKEDHYRPCHTPRHFNSEMASGLSTCQDVRFGTKVDSSDCPLTTLYGLMFAVV